MKMLLIETLVGFLLSLAGFGLLYESLINILFQDLLSITVALVLIGLGVFVLFRAGRRDKHIPRFYEDNSHDALPTKSQIEKNNELLSLYNKTIDMRTKLRALKRTHS